MVLRVALCRDGVASGMTSRQQASLEATTIKTVSDGVKRQEKVIRVEKGVVVVMASRRGER